MAWPLIIAGVALMVGAGAGASSEEGGDILDLKYPDASSEEQLAANLQAELATKLYNESGKDDPEFYKKVFENLPETKMSPEARSRLTQAYKEVNLLADQKAMERASMAFGEKMDDMVSRGAMSATQADKQKAMNDARVRAMMATIYKKWQATEIADARKMWMGDQKSGAATVGSMANVKQKNQALMTQAIDAGLNYSLKTAMAKQSFAQQQMWANEKVLAESRQAEYDFWGKMLMPGQGGGGGSNWQSPQQSTTYSGNTAWGTNTGYVGNSAWGGAANTYGGGSSMAWYS